MLLPKMSGAGALNEFRLIRISDSMVRCFHKIMGQRMEMHLLLSLWQKAFQSSDGIGDLV